MARTTPFPRRALPALASAALLVTVAACGGGATPDAAAPGAAAPSGAYPVTIEHKYGSTEITAEPQRIVLVGLNEQDALLALGKVPVGTSNFLDAPNGIHPWAEQAIGTAPRPTLLDQTDGIPYEEVAALDPDLIIGLYSGLTQENYDTLTDIAPVVAQPAGQEDYTIAWQDTTRTLGRILAKEDQAEQLVTDTEALFTAAREENPEFQGASAVMATVFEGYYFFGEGDARGRLLSSLGFTVPPELAPYINADGFGGTVPNEQVSVFDVDALVWIADTTTEGVLRGDALYNSLNVTTQGREIFVDENDPASDAVSFVTPLSIPQILDELVPRLAAAVDGDPATATS